MECSNAKYSSCLTIYYHTLGSVSRHCGFSASYLNDPKGPFINHKITNGHIEMGGMEKKSFFQLGNDCKYMEQSFFLSNFTTCRCTSDHCNIVPSIDSSIIIFFIFLIVLCVLLLLFTIIIFSINCQGCCKLFSVCKCRQKSENDDDE